MTSIPNDAPKDPAQPKAPAADPRTLDAQELFQGTNEIFIRLGEARYRLRITRRNRLILHR